LVISPTNEPAAVQETHRMERDQLKRALQDLQDRLETTDAIDPELAALLEDLDRDIHALLEKEEPDAEQAGFLLEQARAVDARLFAKHPQIEAMFRELVNALARMGI
jgi:hypothetical protein